MKVAGTKLICDRCGTWDFTSQTDFNGYTISRGPTSSDEFYTNEGCSYPGWTRRHDKDLCRACTAQYDENVRIFFGKPV